VCHKDVEQIINTRTNLQCKILQTYYSKIISYIYTQKFHLQSSRSVCVGRYLLHTALSFVLSFLRIVTLGGKLQNIVMPGLNILF